MRRSLRWIDQEILLGDLPRPARWFGITILLGALPAEALWLLAFRMNLLSADFWACVGLACAALLIEARLFSLRSYGFAHEPITGGVSLLALLIAGPSFLPTFVLLAAISRILTRPHIRLYRQLVSSQIYFLNGAAAACVLMVLPAWHSLPLAVGVVVVATAGMVMSVTSIVMVNSMIARAQSERMDWRAAGQEIMRGMATDIMNALGIVLFVSAYIAWGPIGLLLMTTVVFAPLMLMLAPHADLAWKLISDATGTQALQARRRERLEQALLSESELAYTDPVTGLGNRYRYDRDLAALREANGPAVLIIGDIAGLKAVNDRRGHDAGDELIRIGAQALRRALRDSDSIYRFGGDEFAALIPAAKPAEMERILERINNEVRRGMSGTAELKGVRSWMRLGWASSAEGVEDLYARADRTLTDALKQEKSMGLAVHA